MSRLEFDKKMKDKLNRFLMCVEEIEEDEAWWFENFTRVYHGEHLLDGSYIE